MGIEIQKVKFNDLLWPQVRQIRFDVFVEEQKVDEEEEYDEYEEESAHFLAFADGKAAGTARWRKTEKGVKLERFAVLIPFRGMGVGAALVRATLGEVLPMQEPGSEIYLHAQVQALPFYEKLGFRAYGDLFYEAGIAHRKMRFEGKNTAAGVN
jgi:predicted GNAT family N-acyltransferase